MPTPKSKKPPSVKPVEPKAKFSIGQKVFIIDQFRKSSGEVLQGEIQVVRSVRFPVKTEAGKTTGSEIRYEYDVLTANGTYYDKSEYVLYPTLQSVALAFTQNFTTLLK